MKKNWYIILFVFTFFLFTCDAFAYTCKYNFKQKKKEDGYVKFSVDGDKFSWSGDFSGVDLGRGKSYVIDFALGDKYEEFRTRDDDEIDVNDVDGANKVLVNFLDGKCARFIYVCSSSGIKLASTKNDYAIMLDTGLKSDFVQNALKINGWGVAGAFKKKAGEDTCSTLEINEEESDGEIVELYNTECDFYNEYIYKEEGSSTVTGGVLKGLYDSCNNDAKCLTEYNHDKDKLKTFCGNVLKNGDVGVNACVEKCLKISEDISDIEGTTTNVGECKFSDRVVKWIANIFKWVKYIAPVLVIIFGIMDFIKAIAAQNEDEMKKAQSRFIRRLIVAALVFIVPFLIEYILTAFKIVTDNPYCGII